MTLQGMYYPNQMMVKPSNNKIVYIIIFLIIIGLGGGAFYYFSGSDCVEHVCSGDLVKVDDAENTIGDTDDKCCVSRKCTGNSDSTIDVECQAGSKIIRDPDYVEGSSDVECCELDGPTSVVVFEGDWSNMSSEDKTTFTTNFQTDTATLLGVDPSNIIILDGYPSTGSVVVQFKVVPELPKETIEAVITETTQFRSIGMPVKGVSVSEDNASAKSAERSITSPSSNTNDNFENPDCPDGYGGSSCNLCERGWNVMYDPAQEKNICSECPYSYSTIETSDINGPETECIYTLPDCNDGEHINRLGLCERCDFENNSFGLTTNDKDRTLFPLRHSPTGIPDGEGCTSGQSGCGQTHCSILKYGFGGSHTGSSLGGGIKTDGYRPGLTSSEITAQLGEINWTVTTRGQYDPNYYDVCAQQQTTVVPPTVVPPTVVPPTVEPPTVESVGESCTSTLIADPQTVTPEDTTNCLLTMTDITTPGSCSPSNDTHTCEHNMSCTSTLIADPNTITENDTTNCTLTLGDDDNRICSTVISNTEIQTHTCAMQIDEPFANVPSHEIRTNNNLQIRQCSAGAYASLIPLFYKDTNDQYIDPGAVYDDFYCIRKNVCASSTCEGQVTKPGIVGYGYLFDTETDCENSKVCGVNGDEICQWFPGTGDPETATDEMKIPYDDCHNKNMLALTVDSWKGEPIRSNMYTKHRCSNEDGSLITNSDGNIPLIEEECLTEGGNWYESSPITSVDLDAIMGYEYRPLISNITWGPLGVVGSGEISNLNIEEGTDTTTLINEGLINDQRIIKEWFCDTKNNILLDETVDNMCGRGRVGKKILENVASYPGNVGNRHNFYQSCSKCDDYTGQVANALRVTHDPVTGESLEEHYTPCQNCQRSGYCIEPQCNPGYYFNLNQCVKCNSITDADPSIISVHEGSAIDNPPIICSNGNDSHFNESYFKLKVDFPGDQTDSPTTPDEYLSADIDKIVNLLNFEYREYNPDDSGYDVEGICSPVRESIALGAAYGQNRGVFGSPIQYDGSWFAPDDLSWSGDGGAICGSFANAESARLNHCATYTGTTRTASGAPGELRTTAAEACPTTCGMNQLPQGAQDPRIAEYEITSGSPGSVITCLYNHTKDMCDTDIQCKWTPSIDIIQKNCSPNDIVLNTEHDHSFISDLNVVINDTTKCPSAPHAPTLLNGSLEDINEYIEPTLDTDVGLADCNQNLFAALTKSNSKLYHQSHLNYKNVLINEDPLTSLTDGGERNGETLLSSHIYQPAEKSKHTCGYPCKSGYKLNITENNNTCIPCSHEDVNIESSDMTTCSYNSITQNNQCKQGYIHRAGNIGIGDQSSTNDICIDCLKGTSIEELNIKSTDVDDEGNETVYYSCSQYDEDDDIIVDLNIHACEGGMDDVVGTTSSQYKAHIPGKCEKINEAGEREPQVTMDSYEKCGICETPDKKTRTDCINAGHIWNKAKPAFTDTEQSVVNSNLDSDDYVWTRDKCETCSGTWSLSDDSNSITFSNHAGGGSACPYVEPEKQNMSTDINIYTPSFPSPTGQRLGNENTTHSASTRTADQALGSLRKIVWTHAADPYNPATRTTYNDINDGPKLNTLYGVQVASSLTNKGYEPGFDNTEDSVVYFQRDNSWGSVNNVKLEDPAICERSVAVQDGDANTINGRKNMNNAIWPDTWMGESFAHDFFGGMSDGIHWLSNPVMAHYRPQHTGDSQVSTKGRWLKNNTVDDGPKQYYILPDEKGPQDEARTVRSDGVAGYFFPKNSSHHGQMDVAASWKNIWEIMAVSDAEMLYHWHSNRRNNPSEQKDRPPDDVANWQPLVEGFDAVDGTRGSLNRMYERTQEDNFSPSANPRGTGTSANVRGPYLRMARRSGDSIPGTGDEGAVQWRADLSTSTHLSGTDWKWRNQSKGVNQDTTHIYNFVGAPYRSVSARTHGQGGLRFRDGCSNHDDCQAYRGVGGGGGHWNADAYEGWSLGELHTYKVSQEGTMGMYNWDYLDGKSDGMGGGGKIGGDMAYAASTIGASEVEHGVPGSCFNNRLIGAESTNDAFNHFDSGSTGDSRPSTSLGSYEHGRTNQQVWTGSSLWGSKELEAVESGDNVLPTRSGSSTPSATGGPKEIPINPINNGYQTAGENKNRYRTGYVAIQNTIGKDPTDPTSRGSITLTPSTSDTGCIAGSDCKQWTEQTFDIGGSNCQNSEYGSKDEITTATVPSTGWHQPNGDGTVGGAWHADYARWVHFQGQSWREKRGDHNNDEHGALIPHVYHVLANRGKYYDYTLGSWANNGGSPLGGFWRAGDGNEWKNEATTYESGMALMRNRFQGLDVTPSHHVPTCSINYEEDTSNTIGAGARDLWSDNDRKINAHGHRVGDGAYSTASTGPYDWAKCDMVNPQSRLDGQACGGHADLDDAGQKAGTSQLPTGGHGKGPACQSPREKYRKSEVYAWTGTMMTDLNNWKVEGIWSDPIKKSEGSGVGGRGSKLQDKTLKQCEDYCHSEGDCKGFSHDPFRDNSWNTGRHAIYDGAGAGQNNGIPGRCCRHNVKNNTDAVTEGADEDLDIKIPMTSKYWSEPTAPWGARSFYMPYETFIKCPRDPIYAQLEDKIFGVTSISDDGETKLRTNTYDDLDKYSDDKLNESKTVVGQLIDLKDSATSLQGYYLPTPFTARVDDASIKKRGTNQQLKSLQDEFNRRQLFTKSKGGPLPLGTQKEAPGCIIKAMEQNKIAKTKEYNFTKEKINHKYSELGHYKPPHGSPTYIVPGGGSGEFKYGEAVSNTYYKNLFQSEGMPATDGSDGKDYDARQETGGKEYLAHTIPKKRSKTKGVGEDQDIGFRLPRSDLPHGVEDEWDTEGSSREGNLSQLEILKDPGQESSEWEWNSPAQRPCYGSYGAGEGYRGTQDLNVPCTGGSCCQDTNDRWLTTSGWKKSSSR
jgi:hypothetical protein